MIAALITCGTCGHWTPSSFNPAQGAGVCRLGVLPKSMTWPWRGFPVAAYPHVERECRHWSEA